MRVVPLHILKTQQAEVDILLTLKLKPHLHIVTIQENPQVTAPNIQFPQITLTPHPMEVMFHITMSQQAVDMKLSHTLLNQLLMVAQ